MMINCENICEGCPAAFALGYRDEELQGLKQEMQQDMPAGMVAMKLAEMKTAALVLNQVAGEIDCKNQDKEISELPEAVPEIGSDELIEFVSACPSFGPYLAARQASIEDK